MAYDPFTQRRKIPAFPSVFARTRVGDYRTQFGPVSVINAPSPGTPSSPPPAPLDPFGEAEENSIPMMPDSVAGPGIASVPPFPDVPPPPGPAVMPTDSSPASSSPASSTTQMPVPIGDQSSADQTQRYYDRKFGRMSHDPAERMASRRIDGSAPLSPRSQIGQVTFRSTDANGNPNGHSDWVPY